MRFFYLLNYRSALKPSRSFPNELNDNDNSSSGVSSDQEKNSSGNSGSGNHTTTKFVTYLPVESNTPIQTQITKSRTYDSESSESSFDSNGPQSEQKITTMKKMLHPKLAAIFDLPGGGQKYASQTLPNKSKLKKALSTSNSTVGQNNSNNSERSISESLALINQHVTSLGEVNHLAQEPLAQVMQAKPAPGMILAPSPGMVLAPPPGFSDPESYSDNESLSSNGSKGGFSQGGHNGGVPNKSKVSFGKTSSKPTKKHEHQHWNMTRSMEGFLDQSVQGENLFSGKLTLIGMS